MSKVAINKQCQVLSEARIEIRRKHVAGRLVSLSHARPSTQVGTTSTFLHRVCAHPVCFLFSANIEFMTVLHPYMNHLLHIRFDKSHVPGLSPSRILARGYGEILSVQGPRSVRITRQVYKILTCTGSGIAPFFPVQTQASGLYLPVHCFLFLLRLPILFAFTLSYFVVLQWLPIGSLGKKASLWAILGVPSIWWIDLQIDGVRKG